MPFYWHGVPVACLIVPWRDKDPNDHRQGAVPAVDRRWRAAGLPLRLIADTGDRWLQLAVLNTHGDRLARRHWREPWKESMSLVFLVAEWNQSRTLPDSSESLDPAGTWACFGFCLAFSGK